MKYLTLITFLTLTTLYSCSKDEEEEEQNNDSSVVPVDSTDSNSGQNADTADAVEPLCSSGMIHYAKAVSSIEPEQDFQDKISDKIWITRGAGGQIFNFVSESEASKQTSPLGTLWAVGNLNDTTNLNFEPFRTAVGTPSAVVGKKLVMYLVEEKVYLAVEFTKWDSNKTGGFAYCRSEVK